MLLSNSLVWALEPYEISGVEVTCDAAAREEISAFFLKKFTEEWKNAQEKVEATYGDCWRGGEFPASVTLTETGFVIRIAYLDIRHTRNEYYDLSAGSNALENTLKAVQEAYPVSCAGYIGTVVSDVKAGEAVQWEIGAEDEHKTYHWVGEVLGKVFSEGYYIPEEPYDAEDLTFVVTGKLQHFENREEITEYIEDLGGKVSGSISRKTNYLINNDLESTSSKNKKAKDLGIPIIGEGEFLARFAEEGEYDIPGSEFWLQLAEEMWANEDFEETLQALYGYAAWIKKADLDRTVRTILDIAGEEDEDLREELKEFVQTLKAGENQ